MTKSKVTREQLLCAMGEIAVHSQSAITILNEFLGNARIPAEDHSTVSGALALLQNIGLMADRNGAEWHEDYGDWVLSPEWKSKAAKPRLEEVSS